MSKSASIPHLQFGEPAVPARASPEVLDVLARRRSTPANQMSPGGPDAEELAALLRLATRVPDHGKLSPWRFIVFEGDARARAGEVLREALQRCDPAAGDERLAAEEARFTRAHVVVAVVSSPLIPHKIPVWEQQLSAGAVCQSLLLAAHAMGYASQWLTEWYAYDPSVLAAFGLQPGEAIAGYIYLGNAPADAFERARPDVMTKTHWFEGAS